MSASTQVPPGTPPPSPPPPGPTGPTPTGPPSRAADDTIFTAVAQLYADLARPVPPRPPSKPPRKPTNTKPIRLTTPARQGASPVAVAAAVGFPLSPGGSVQPPVATGKEPTPGSAAALSGAARGSTGSDAGAGVRVRACPDQGGGRAVGAGGAVTFALPLPAGPDGQRPPFHAPPQPPPPPSPLPMPPPPPPVGG